jgi:hypothetical protein
MHTHSPNKPKKFRQTLSACQKVDGTQFLGQERSAEGGIHATRDHNNIRSALQITKETMYGHTEQKVWNAKIQYVVLLHDKACPHTSAHTRALPEHVNWELFDHPPYSPDLALSD